MMMITMTRISMVSSAQTQLKLLYSHCEFSLHPNCRLNPVVDLKHSRSLKLDFFDLEFQISFCLSFVLHLSPLIVCTLSICLHAITCINITARVQITFVYYWALNLALNMLLISLPPFSLLLGYSCLGSDF